MAGSRVVLGVSGGIAAYKAVDVCRRLVDAGCHVVPVLTRAAARFVGEVTFSALASEPAQTGLWDEVSPIPHTRLGQGADLVLVVPATADLLARYAAGMADDLLTATLLATRAPVVVCPAMHTEMWEHPAVIENLATLRRRGVTVVEPVDGRLAGGDAGMGRLAEPSDIVAAARAVLGLPRAAVAPGDLAGRTVVVSAGGTREPIDPVRVISNRSSGRQGHALAEVAARRGASVVVVTASPLPLGAMAGDAVRRVQVETASEMQAALAREAPAADVVVMAAAVSDFRPVAIAPQKLARDAGVTAVELEPTADILAGLAARRRSGQVLVGFAAETGDAIARALAKLERKGVDLLVVNDVSAPGAGFDHDTNQVTILQAGPDAPGPETLPLCSKHEVAEAIFDRVVRRLEPRQEPARS